MLKVTEVSSFKQRSFFLLQTERKTTYIVPDIKTKFQFQNFILEKNRLYPDQVYIFRASDFFRDLLHKTLPSWRVVSKAQLQLIFKLWTQRSKPNFPPHHILNTLRSYLPIMVHPEGGGLYKEWAANSAPGTLKNKTLTEFKIAQDFFKELKNLKIIENSCIKYLLLDRDLSCFKTPLIVDLRWSLDRTEADIFSQLSRKADVTILSPPLLEESFYPKSNQVYSFTRAKLKHPPSKKTKDLNKKHPSNKKTAPKITVQKFSSPLNEIRFTVNKLRQDIDSGIRPQDLAVIAPRIEDYWPSLRGYLKKEGLSFQKGYACPFLSFPQIQKWFSCMELYSGNICFENLESAFLSQKEEMNYSSLRLQYYHCDRKDDLKKNPINNSQAQKKQTAQDFLKWALDLWNPIIKKHPNLELDSKLKNNLASFISVFLRIKNTPAEPIDWITAFEGFLSQSDFNLEKESSKGISFLSLNAAASAPAKKIYFIGLDHDSCSTPSDSIFSETEAEQISQELGFQCFPLDTRVKEYEIAGFVQCFQGEISLSYSTAGFDGSPLQPAKIWLLERKNIKKQAKENTPPLVKKPLTVWDSIKRIKGESFSQISTAEEKIKAISLKEPLALSPSHIKDYIQCPFIFLSKKIFHLEDQPEINMDLKPAAKGHIYHILFQKIIENKIQTEKDLLALIQSLKQELKVLDSSVWNFYESLLLKKGVQFLQNESQNKKLLPDIQTIGTEVSFKGYWNLKKKTLAREGDILIRGRIDRIDLISSQILIIDYKASDKSSKVISHWAGSGSSLPDCQMPLYLQAVSAGLADAPKKQISGAVYLSYKNFQSKGFILKDSEFKRLNTISKRSEYDEEKKNKILEKVNSIIQKYILLIQEGRFPANPLNKKDCPKCYWRTICRAPHLN